MPTGKISTHNLSKQAATLDSTATAIGIFITLPQKILVRF